MTDHAAALLAAGLTLALFTGVLGAKFMQSMRDLYQAQGRLRNARTGMRSARLRFLLLAAVLFAIAWPWLHGLGRARHEVPANDARH